MSVLPDKTILLSALSALALGACAPAPAPEREPRPVRVQAAETRTAADALRYSATLQPREQVVIAFAIGGYVTELRREPGADGALRDLQPGDRVARGTVLARIRESDYREQLAQARAQQSEAAAGMTKARLDFERAERLYATQSLTRPDLEAARASFETARARLAAADAAQRAAELVLRDASLAAPMDAVVLSRTIERGTLASPGVAAFTLADVSALKAVFGVPEQIASALAPGDRIDVESASVAHAGTITAIAPAADSDSRVFRVEVTLPNTNGSLKPGTIATAIVRASGAAKVSDLLQLPLSAVVSAGDGDYGVFVLDGARDPAVARLRRVEIGPVLNDNTVAVTAGLAPDDVAIVSGAPLLVDGESVRVIP